MPEIPDSWLVHTVTVEPQVGEGAYGDSYGPPVQVRCFRDDARQVVRNASGAEVVSETTLYCKLDRADVFPPDSRVTLTDGSVSYVVLTKRRDDGGMGAPQHLEVTMGSPVARRASS